MDNTFLQVFQTVRSRTSQIPIDFNEVSAEGQQVIDIYKNLNEKDFRSFIEDCFKSKCVEKSKNLREEGNKLFQKKAFQKALEKFNQSVVLAPWKPNLSDGPEDPVYAYALANRSAVLFYIKQFRLCIRDIEASVGQGYPDHLKYKLSERKAKCIEQLGDLDEAAKEYQTSLDQLELSDLDKKARAKWKKSVNDKLRKLKNKKLTQRRDSPQDLNLSKKPSVTGPDSSKFICTSNAFDLLHTDDKGRDIVAGREVHVGDVLGVEKPYSAVPNLDHIGRVCDHCIGQVVAPRPCRNCSHVVYCSSTCECEAWDEYHSVECSFVGWLRRAAGGNDTSNLGKITQLALRISLRAGYEKLHRYFNNMEGEATDCSLEAGFTDGVFLNDYHSVFCMASNKPARPVGVRKDYAALAAVMISVLDSSGFFTRVCGQSVSSSGAIPVEVTNEKTGEQHVSGIRLIYAASLVHHMQIIQCNAYGIVENDCPQGAAGFRVKEAVYTGLGLYPTMGLLNHSCDPVLDVSFTGSTAVYRAYKNVRPGGQITVDYGPIYYLQDKQERQEHLQDNYYFNCQCPPCRHNWPLWEEIDSKVPKFKCPLCDTNFPDDILIGSDVTCLNCGQVIDLVAFLQQLGESHGNYALAMERAREGDTREALPVLERHLSLIQRVIAPPWKEFITCQAVIDQCYRMNAMSNVA